MQEEITLCEQINDSEVEKTIIFCDVESITQSEFEAVGQKDIKPQYKFVVWSFEYSNQTEIEYNGQRLTVYRTYKRKNEEKTELYAEKRVADVEQRSRYKRPCNRDCSRAYRVRPERSGRNKTIVDDVHKRAWTN